MARGKKYTKRKNLRKRRGTKRQRARQRRCQKGGRGMTTSVDTNPNEMNEEEYILARQMRIVD